VVRKAWQDRQSERQQARRDVLPPERGKSEQAKLLDEYITRELLVQRALRRLPAIYRSRLDGLAVVLEDEPTPEQRRDLGLAPRELLFGLYDGVPLTDPARYTAAIAFPDRIILYQRSFERSCSTREEVEEEVRLTVIHEVGHHFGLDEEALHHV
ncbi:MAG: metallopeptidase family protein, partial [Chloroflexi bacterium]|nr:metallopeptidase family protein [Chloroflexota bacterium]